MHLGNLKENNWPLGWKTLISSQLHDLFLSIALEVGCTAKSYAFSFGPMTQNKGKTLWD